MKILIADTYYPDFLASLPFNPAGTYESELRAVLAQQFGTADFFSRNLRAMGHECVDVIANHHSLQWKWAEENYSGQGRRNEQILDLQIEKFQPDVIFFQDLSLKVPDSYKGLIAAQCSCAFDPEAAKRCDVIFTSLPGHLAKFESLGVRAVYLPLAFEPSVLEGPQPERDIDISFVGGVGRNSHWKSGTDTLEIVAEAFRERFHWYGYGLDNLPASSALLACYRGEAWGREQYAIYRRSKIVINRHGEVAQGYANNLRMFEATGCGALLLTEEAPNLKDFFDYSQVEDYANPAQAVRVIRYMLKYADERQRIAANGQARTLRDHTYAQRMPIVSETLAGMITKTRCAV